MKTFKTIEKKSQILGMPLADLMFVSTLLIVLIVLGGIAGAFMEVSKYYYLISLLIVVILFLILKTVNQKKHPSFLLSWLSYHFFQAKKIKL